MSKPKKPFKETKIGKFIHEKVKPVAGDVLQVVGDLTGIEAVEKVGEFINGRRENDAQMQALWIEFEKQKLEMELELTRIDLDFFKAEVQDRDSARNMRNEFTKAGKVDWEHFTVNIVAIVAFFWCVGFLLFYTVPEENREFIIHILGIFEGVVLGIYAFHNGSTAGSRRKSEQIERLTK